MAIETTVSRLNKGLILLQTDQNLALPVRSVLLSPGLVTGLLGCETCSYFGTQSHSSDPVIRPRMLSDVSDNMIHFSCNGIGWEGASCSVFAQPQTTELHPLKEGRHSMRRAIIKLTDTCQMGCIYCVNADGQIKTQQITPETFYDILAQFRPEEIEITGGEPAARFPLLLEAVKIAKLFSDFIMINTNMELLDEKRIKQLEEAGLSHLHFALHTLHPEMHKIIRGKPYADLAKVHTLIDYSLNQTHLKLIPEFVPMKVNFDEFPRVYEFIRQLRRIYGDRIVELEVGRLIPSGRANEEMAPSIEDLLPVFFSIGKPEYPVEVFCFGKKTASRLEQMGFQIYPCDAGSGMFYFELDGRVLGDNFSGAPVADNFKNFDPSSFGGIKCPFR